MFYADPDLQHREPVTTLAVRKFQEVWMDAVREVLNRHHCLMEECEENSVIVFPEGTAKYELWPRVNSPRYILQLPDGAEFLEVMPRTVYSYLSFYEEELSPEKQQ